MADTRAATESKNPNIALPSKFILSDDGLSYCAQNSIPIRDFTTYEGHRKTGFHWEAFKAPLVQKLVVNNFLEGIDIERTECLSKRQEIIDLTKLLVYGNLYKKFKPTLERILMDSDVIQKIVTNKMKRNVGNTLTFDPVVVKKFISENLKTIRALRNSLLFDPYALVDNDEELNEKEKVEKKKIVLKFIDQIDDNTWFLFHFVSKTDNKLYIIEQLNNTIIDFVKKTKIADYTAFMLMEVIQNAEKSHFERLARYKKHLGNGGELSDLLKKREFRAMLQKHAIDNKQFLNLNFKFDGDAFGVSKQNRMKLQIKVVNKGTFEDYKRLKLESKAQTDVDGVSLASFLKRVEKQEKLGAGLGLYYLSYLQKACVQEKMWMEARLVPDNENDRTFAIVFLHI